MNRALQTATDYINTSSALRGCINDVNNVMNDVIPYLNIDNTTQLLNKKYTAKALRVQLDLHTRLIKENDMLFFQNSSHGTYVKDMDSNELDGYDEALCPDDIHKNFNKNLITDDELHKWLCMFPKGSFILMLCDACHSGTLYRDFKPLNSVSRHIVNPDVLDITSKTKAHQIVDNDLKCDVVYISGCKDNQTSADAYIDNMYQGAMTYSFIKTLKKYNYKITYKELVENMCECLKEHRFIQTPQLSTTNIDNKLFGKF